MERFGLVNVNKPAGVTSRQVVNQLQRLVRPAKAGHAGTLDPIATGVLVVCIGRATRLIEYVQRMPKEYVASFLLGHRSETDDVESEVTRPADLPEPSRHEIERAVEDLVGEIDQRPPAYSAIKVKGKRAYALARAGHRVELAARTVVVHSLRVVHYDYPNLELHICCGSGTYVRSLGRDLAAAMGTFAVLSGLARTVIGDFRIQDACSVDQLSPESLSQVIQSPLRAVSSLPVIRLSPVEQQQVAHGIAIQRADWDGYLEEDQEEFAAVDETGRLLALLRRRPQGGLGPVRNFSAT